MSDGGYKNDGGIGAEDALCNDWYAFSVEAVHHCRQRLQLLLYRVVPEIRIHKHIVGRDKSGVVLEEECG